MTDAWGMDDETAAHVEADRRPPVSNSALKRFSESVGIAETDLSEEVAAAKLPADRFHDQRMRRMRGRRGERMAKLVPIEEITVEHETVFLAEEAPDGALAIEEREDFTGTIHRITATCIGCGRQLQLDSLPTPGVMAQEAAFGVLRRQRGTAMCDPCIETRDAEEDAKNASQRRRERVEASKLPEHMRPMWFNEMIPTGGRKAIVEVVREWAAAENPKDRQICIWGQKGAGKTRLAATACWARLQRWPVQWVSLPQLMAALGASFNDDGRQAAISVITGDGPLILDDIARDDIKVSDWAKNQLFAAIDRRVQSGAPLLLTTNMAPARLGPIIGDSLMSRVAGMAVLELPGRDMRLELPGVKREEEAARHGLRDPEEDIDAPAEG